MSDTKDTEQTDAEYLFSHEFQKGILKMFATNTNFSSNYGTLIVDDYFESHNLRIICGLIRNFVFTYERELDFTTMVAQIDNYAAGFGLSDETTKGIIQDTKAVMNSHITSEQFYIDNLVRFARRQSLKNALIKSVDILQTDGEYDKVLQMIDQAVSVGAGNEDGLVYADLLDLPNRYMQTYDPTKLITTGFKTWDKALEGGAAPGELHVILAPPKAGKSSTLVNIGAANLKLGKNVFHVPLELSKEDTAMKYAMNISGMSKEQITKMSLEAYQHKIKKYDAMKPNLFINFWPEGSVSTMAIRSWISRVRSKTSVSPDVIIIDYDDCLIPTTGKSKDDMYGDAGQVYTDLINLANYFHCPIFTAAQPQRDAWSAPSNATLITHDKLAHSAKKAHKAWSISSLNFTDDGENGILYLDITRRGECKVKIKINKQLTRCWVREVS